MKIPVQRYTWDHILGKRVPYGPVVVVDDEDEPEPTHRARRVPAAQFLKGPIPWDWITRAAALPGKAALVVGLSLWRLRGLKSGSNSVVLGNAELEPFGIGRAAKSRALHALEAAGLIAVAHRKGRLSRVTLLEIQPCTACRARQRR